MKPLTVEYFRFEEDFMEDNIRCIPMIVRFKLDACGIKLKLKEWSKITVEEREQLATLPIDAAPKLEGYKAYVQKLIYTHTGANVTMLQPYNGYGYLSSTESLPVEIEQKLEDLKMSISPTQWKNLNLLQRFALLKLVRPGHENRNFPKAMQEFGLA